MSDLNIYQRINRVMHECDYLQKKEAQQGKGVKFDDLVAMIRDLLVKHGVVVRMNQTEMTLLGGVDNTKQKVYQGRYEMELINMDKPDERILHSVYAQGMDGGDKGTGKAHTYAAKSMLKMAFLVETGEDEESRSEKMDKANLISYDQHMKLSTYCVERGDDGLNVWSEMGKRLLAAYKINDIQWLPASKFEEALLRCKKNANP